VEEDSEWEEEEGVIGLRSESSSVEVSLPPSEDVGEVSGDQRSLRRWMDGGEVGSSGDVEREEREVVGGMWDRWGLKEL
jgi:hypothetical protein